eukprot:3459564-Alexandrium_andersonii.AAC.1
MQCNTFANIHSPRELKVQRVSTGQVTVDLKAQLSLTSGQLHRQYKHVMRRDAGSGNQYFRQSSGPTPHAAMGTPPKESTPHAS